MRLIAYLIAGYFLVGCVVIPTDKLRVGQSLSEFARIIPAKPTQRVPIQIGDQTPFVVLEYLAAIPPDYNPEKRWFLFFDDRLIAWGDGDSRVGQLVASTALYQYAADNGVINLLQSQQLLFSDALRIYGQDLSPDYRELALFKIALAEKVQNGEISLLEYQAKIAEKENLISSRRQQQELASAQARQARIQSALQALTLSHNIFNASQPQVINCTSVQAGVVTNTNCR